MTDLSKYTDKQIVALTAWGENRGGGDTGMQSVINVVFNRLNHERCASNWNPRLACLAPMQFSCWNPMGPNLAKMLAVTPDDPQYASALYMVNQAYANVLKDITNGATHYYAIGTLVPYWAKDKEPCASIAGQLFFNNVA